MLGGRSVPTGRQPDRHGMGATPRQRPRDTGADAPRRALGKGPARRHGTPLRFLQPRAPFAPAHFPTRGGEPEPSAPRDDFGTMHDPSIPEPANADGDRSAIGSGRSGSNGARAKQPPYCIFTNETLEALVRERPRTPQAMAAIKGMGPSRLERHGAPCWQPSPPVRRSRGLRPPFGDGSPPRA
ncbi:MAG: HRDC domain-containing protein [Singulisphaera sp.]